MNTSAGPLVVVVAGPNGAGKSTTAPRLLQGALAVSEFVNADTIAQGLSAFRPESVAVTAGRIMLARLDQLAEARGFRLRDDPGCARVCPAPGGDACRGLPRSSGLCVPT